MTSAPRWPGSRLHDTHVSPRALTLATSIAWRHVASDPVRALVLAQRVLPDPLGRCLRLAGPYGQATALWGTGDRTAALAALDASPRRLAASSLAVDQPAAAAAAQGSWKQKRAPRPGTGSTHMSPPWSSTVCRESASPKPNPLRFPALTNG